MSHARSGNIPYSRRAVVIPQQATKPFAAFNFPGFRSDLLTGIDQTVFQTRMISLRMVMKDVGFQRGTQRTFTEKDHLIQRIGFQASHKSFEI